MPLCFTGRRSQAGRMAGRSDRPVWQTSKEADSEAHSRIPQTLSLRNKRKTLAEDYGLIVTCMHLESIQNIVT